MINKDQLLEALKPLMEPHYNKSVVELNLVRDVMFKEDNVSLSLIVTTEDEAFKEKAKVYIQQTLEKLGIAQVHIRFRLMTDYERNQIKDTAQQLLRNKPNLSNRRLNNPYWEKPLQLSLLPLQVGKVVWVNQP